MKKAFRFIPIVFITFFSIQVYGQIPSITSFTPTAGPIGTTVTVTGLNFNATPANNTVWFGAVKATIASATATSLTVTVPTGATYQPITVTTGGYTAYSSKPFAVTFASTQVIDATSFATKVDFTTGTNTWFPLVNDIDGDGKPDIISPNNGSNTVSVFRNISTSGAITTGSLSAGVSFATGSYPTRVAIGDIDGDGKKDMAVTNGVGNSISLYRNISTSGSITTGSFAASVVITTAAGTNPYGIALGDIDGDGKPDLIITNQTTGTISVYRNTSTSGSITTGSFAAKVDFTVGSNPLCVAIGDIDGDGKPDVVVLNNVNSTVSVFRNISTSGSITTGSLAAKIDFTTGTNPYSVAIGDIDGDGKLDLAMDNKDNNTVSVLRNTSTSGTITAGSFASKVDFTTGTSPMGVAIGDLDGDGKPDLVTANLVGNSISILRNTSTSGSITVSSFATKVDFTCGSGPEGVAIGDVDGDGKPDLIAANWTGNSISVFRNTIASSGLVAYYTFEGNANDMSGNAHNGTFYGTAVYTANRFGDALKACDFDGVNNYVQIPNHTDFNTASTTWSVWFKPKSFNSGAMGHHAIIDKGFTSHTAPYYQVHMGVFGDLTPTGTKGAFSSVFQGTEYKTADNFYIPNTWYHMVLTYDNATQNLKTYINNQIVSVQTIAITNTDWGKDIFVATYGNITTAKTPIIIDDIRVYNRALSVSEVDALFHENGYNQVFDIDGNSYGTVQIGTQTWFSSNLRTTKYSDGTAIPNVTDNTSWTTQTVGAYCWYNNDGPTNSATYGALYNFYTVVDSRNLCPTGWHIPTDSEWKTMEMTLGLTQAQADATGWRGTDQGTQMKSTTLWTSGNGTNTSGFNGLPGGVRNGTTAGTFSVIGQEGSWWRSNEFNATDAYYSNLNYTQTAAGRGTTPKKQGYSVRCIQGVAATSTNPTISNFTPTSGPIGTVVTINGTNFSTTAANNIVYFGTVKATVTAATTTSITVTVPTGATYQPLTVTVGGLTASSKKPFNITFSSSGVIDATSFATKIDFTTGTNPIFPSVCDIDGDGKIDVVLVNNGNTSISAFRNISTSGAISTGSLSGKIDFTTLLNPWGQAVGDIDGDGKLDVVVVDNGGGSISIYRNTSTSGTISSGSFATKVDFTTGTGSDGPQHVAIGDLDMDGKQDIVVSNGTSNNVSVFRNISASGSITTASFAAKVEFATGTNPGFISLNDIDGDGKLDIVVLNNNGNSFSILRNISALGSISTSSFSAKVDFTADAPWGLAIGDIDGDGKPDIVTSSTSNATFSVFRNTSTSGSITASSLATKVDFAVGNNPLSIAIGDIDGDGKPDIALSNKGSNTISVLRNTSTSGSITTSSFATKVDFTTGANPWGVAIGDIDGDGKPDLVVANNTATSVSVLRNTISGSSLVAYFPFTGNANDASGYNHNGTPTAITYVADRFGVASGAAQFNGTTSTVLIGSGLNFVNGGNKFTFSAWVNPSVLNAAGQNTILSERFGAGDNYQFAIASKNLWCTYWTGGVQNNFGGNEIYLNSWQFVTVTYDGVNLIFYVNGQLNQTNATTGLIDNFVSNLHIGSINGTTGYFNGILDEVKIYNRTLSSTEINTLYHEGGWATPPAITSFAPTSGAIGSTMTITGTGFSTIAANNIVYFGAVKATVTAATTTSLTVTVPTGATYQPITVTVGGLTASSSKPFNVTFSSSGVIDATSFATKVDFTSGTAPTPALLADIDGDGKLDLLTVNFTSNTLSVFRNTSTSGSITIGSFAGKVDFVTNTGAIALAAGDIDGDGKLDVVVSSGTTASIYRNQSTSGAITTSSFATKVDYSAGGNGVVIVDIDLDGKLDIATASAGGGSPVLHNISTIGNIAFEARINVPCGTDSYRLATADIDGDGKPDLVISNMTDNTISVVRNISTPGTLTLSSFAAKVDFATGTSPLDVAIADIDGDGKSDIMVSNYGSNTFSVFRNTSVSGSFSASSLVGAVNFSTGTTPQGIAVNDCDGDGKIDVMVANSASGSVSVYKNVSTSGSITLGSLSAKVDYATGMGPNGIASGDLDGDGKPDLVAVNYGGNSVSVIRNTISTINNSITYQAKMNVAIKKGRFIPATDSVIVRGVYNGWSANTDRLLDPNADSTYTGTFNVGTATPPEYKFVIRRNGVDFWEGSIGNRTYTPTGNPQTISPVYFDNDSLTQAPRITSFTPTSGAIGTTVTITGANFTTTTYNNYVWFGAVRATVTSATSTSLSVTVPIGATYQPISVTVGGLTGYSTKPFKVTFSSSGVVDVNSFATKVDFDTSNPPNSIALGDIDGDGKTDLAIVNTTVGSVSVYRNTSSSGTIVAGSFAPKVDFTVGSSPEYLAIADIDGDGKLDIVVGGGSGGLVSVLRNTSASGSISFATKIDFPVGTGPNGVAIADIDGDGKPDVIATNLGVNTISILRNTSISGIITTSSFAPKVDFPTNINPRYVVIGDIDSDGKPDIVIAHTSSATNTVSVFRNTSTLGAITSSSLATKVDFASLTGQGIWGVTLGDLNGDEKLDLITANNSNGVISVFQNTSAMGVINASSFAAKVDFATGIGPNNSVVGDVDGDGKLDIIIPNVSGSSISVLRNVFTSGLITASSFSPKVDYTSGVNPYFVVFGDIDGDSKPDITVVNNASVNFSVLRNTVAPSATTPTIASFTPSSGMVGSTVTIAGTNFGTTQGTSTVKFGTTTATPTSWSATQIVATVPTLADGLYTISVTTSVGIANSTTQYIVTSVTIPTIASFTPTSGAIGTTVTITGTNFSTTAANNIVWFGAVRATVTSATATSLTVSVPAGATYQPITVTVNGLTAYSSVPFNVTFTSTGVIDATSFATKVDLFAITGSNPEGVAIGDIDGDGKIDLVISNTSSGSVSVFRNVSTSGSITTGSFAAKVDFATGTAPFAVTLGDIDGDGKMDLAVTNSGSNTVSLFRNTSTSGSITTGSFAAKVDFTTGPGPYVVAIGDIDGDGKPDLAIANSSSNSVSVLRNTSTLGSITTGSFAAKIEFTTGLTPLGVAIGDLDGDGKPDLTVSNNGAATVSVLKNTSTSGSITTSSFAASVNFTTGTNPAGVALSDLDGDGKLDVIIANDGSASISVLRNTSTSGTITTGSFAAKVDFTVGTNPDYLSAGDINGDGKPDIAVTNFGSASVSIFRNNSTSGSITASSFAAKFDLAVGSNPLGIALGDFDGDGKFDIVAANYTSNTVSILRNTIAASASTPTISSFTPSSGLAGSSVTINGTNFGTSQGTSTVKFGTTTATATTWNATQIIATVPSLTAGTYTITVTTTGGIANSSSQFTVNTAGSAPTITSFTPSSGVIGATVTVNGTNFGATQGSSTIKFGSTVATVTTWSATQIVATVPNLVAGTYTITVTTTGGSVNSGSLYTVTIGSGIPVINSFSPTFGAPGSTITIYGTLFASQTAWSSVKFGTTAATITSWSNLQIVATVPMVAAGAYTIYVSAINGTGYSSTQYTVTVPQCATPTIKKKGSLNILVCQTPNGTYQWYKDDVAISGATKQFYLARKSYGSYSVQVTLGNGCDNRSASMVVNTAGSISVYPNPGDKLFNVELNFEELGFTTIKLVNAFGTVKRVITINKDTDTQTIPISIEDLEKGIYMIDVEVNGEKIETQKVVII